MTLQDLAPYRGTRVLVTGHTGFKGSWLCETLLLAGAEVHGYALRPPTRPALFAQLGLARRLASHTICDVRDAASLAKAVRRVAPDFVFHLAAQPLVRESYRRPAETFDANVMGTINLLEALRTAPRRNRPDRGPCAVVCVTTDKCYENDDSGHPFREDDPLGGSDPYSASKGACEIAIAAYRRSFFSSSDSPVRLASARAGNVIGGGDWAADRIVPDAVRAIVSGRELVVRNRRSTRPWQHVLEPLSGYLALGDALRRDASFAQAFNFGPDSSAVRTVGDLIRLFGRRMPGLRVLDRTDPNAPHEAKALTLDSSKAARLLGWRPSWDFRTAVAATAAWYRAVQGGAPARETTVAQIRDFLK